MNDRLTWSSSANTRSRVDRVERVGQADVLDACSSAKTSASPSLAQQTPTAPRADLDQREVGALVGLGVRPEPQSADFGGLLHVVDVALDLDVIDQDAGRPQLRDVHSRECTSGLRQEAERRGHPEAGEHAGRIGEPEMAAHDLVEHGAEVGGDREVASLVPLLAARGRAIGRRPCRRARRRRAPSSRCRGRDRCRGCRSRRPRARTPTWSG